VIAEPRAEFGLVGLLLVVVAALVLVELFA
jgi:hypothetical protein